MSLGDPLLSVILQSEDPCLLLLLIKLLLHVEELHAWLQCSGPLCDHRIG
jgi:hypothetical protein